MKSACQKKVDVLLADPGGKLRVSVSISVLVVQRRHPLTSSSN